MVVRWMEKKSILRGGANDNGILGPADLNPRISVKLRREAPGRVMS